MQTTRMHMSKHAEGHLRYWVNFVGCGSNCDMMYWWSLANPNTLHYTRFLTISASLTFLIVYHLSPWFLTPHATQSKNTISSMAEAGAAAGEEGAGGVAGVGPEGN